MTHVGIRVQEYIKQQIEEKARLKREERERRVQEEILEEQRLQRERDAMQGLTSREAVKHKEKEVCNCGPHNGHQPGRTSL